MIDRIQQLLDTCITGKIFPGGALGILRQGEKKIVTAGRLTYDPHASEVAGTTVYDVASITKAIPTACLALQLVEEGVLSLTSRLVDYVPECTGRFHDQIRLSHLLTHTLDFTFRLSDKKHLPAGEIFRAISSADLITVPGSRHGYANATSILLGRMIEHVAGTRLDHLAKKRFFGPLGMTSTAFFPEPTKRSRIAPTEIDPWRNREIRGEVHDESAWALRDACIAGSAGLFSTAPDLMRFLEMLLNKGTYKGRRYFSEDTIGLMHANALPAGLGTTAALGWELDQERFMGTGRSPTTFGKTGFTGCAVVADICRETGMVMLTNHTWPVRKKDREEINRVRRELTGLVFSR
jgi:CubicO group peptidase (beta-lactamase class C family)